MYLYMAFAAATTVQAAKITGFWIDVWTGAYALRMLESVLETNE